MRGTPSAILCLGFFRFRRGRRQATASKAPRSPAHRRQHRQAAGAGAEADLPCRTCESATQGIVLQLQFFNLLIHLEKMRLELDIIISG